MGLVDELGYSRRTPTALQRWVIRLASTRPLSAVNRRALPSLDRLALRLTGGKTTLTTVSSGLPIFWLTTVGARSGLLRTVPLLGFPLGGDLAVIGTGFGQRATPGWVHNLEARGEAVVSRLGVEIDVRARLAEAAEAELIWDQARRVYPGYAKYAGWAQHRTIRVFVLEKAVSGGGD
jgi:deazaflavin-dependent oxidoreductase (nitroreductase family)